MTVYHLINATGHGWPLPDTARPGSLTLSPGSPELTRAYGQDQILRTDDGLGNIQPVVLTWRERGATADALEARARAWEAWAASARWLTTQGRAATALQGGFLVASPVDGVALYLADFQLILAPARTRPVGIDGGKVTY